MLKLFIFLSFLFITPLFAADEVKLWESNAEASLLLTSGNTQVNTIGLGLSSAFRPDPWALKGKAAFLTSSNFATKTAESYDFSLRGERKVVDSLNGFLSTLYLKNEFIGFRDRVGFELGLNYLILSKNGHELSTEAGAGYLIENLITGYAGTSLGNRNFVTAHLGLEYKWKFSPTAEFSNVIAFLDNLQMMQDWRLSNIASLTAMLSDIFSLKISFKVDYLNVPVTGKLSTDTATTAALVAKF